MKDFDALVEVMARLRSGEGCPWDREQTHATLKPYLLEEAYEVLEAIDQENDGELCQELGDVLLQVVFHAQVAREEGRFAIGEVCRAIVDKLVRRHPHVFGEAQVSSAGEVWTQWERLKRVERGGREVPPSFLDGTPLHLPALLRAQRLQHKASRAGFDWEQIEGPLDKVEEEFAELRRAAEEGVGEALEEEFGDLLFALVNTGRFLGLCPEDALRRAADKFERRFRALEKEFQRRGKNLEDASPEEMDRVWEGVKEGEASSRD